MKNNILVSQDVKTIYLNKVICDVDCDTVSCINKATSDFVFSIDNSVIGDENAILIMCSACFLKFNPCFYAFISCDFLTVDGFFGSDFTIASELFCYFVVEFSEGNRYLMNFQNNLEFNPISGLSDMQIK